MLCSISSVVFSGFLARKSFRTYVRISKYSFISLILLIYTHIMNFRIFYEHRFAPYVWIWVTVSFQSLFYKKSHHLLLDYIWIGTVRYSYLVFQLKQSSRLDKSNFYFQGKIKLFFVWYDLNSFFKNIQILPIKWNIFWTICTTAISMHAKIVRNKPFNHVFHFNILIIYGTILSSPFLERLRKGNAYYSLYYWYSCDFSDMFIYNWNINLLIIGLTVDIGKKQTF